MATVLDIVRGISQALANNYDGPHVEEYSSDGEARKAGLKREEGNPMLDARVMDGFKCRFHGNKLIINYHSEASLKDLHKGRNKFESEVESQISDIVKFLKKEYKKVTGNTLSLKKDGEVDIRFEYMNKIRSWITAKQQYEIGGLKDVVEVGEESKDRLDQSIKDWLQLGKNSPKPKNVKI